jgi:hypothetical protein
MAVSNAPQRDARILVTDRSGHARHAKTDAHGVATFSLTPGRYAVTGPCGLGPKSVTVRPDHAAHVELHCDVP